ncbi:MAG: hypothetical protein LLF84_08865 [Methanoregulaceae archaeon]|nr:hypothetical protein [Methanoregulaceae archaeon]
MSTGAPIVPCSAGGVWFEGDAPWYGQYRTCMNPVPLVIAHFPLRPHDRYPEVVWPWR